MNIHYKIVEVWPNDHLIVARYWTDVLSEQSLNSFPNDTNCREDGSPFRCRSDVSITVPIPAPSGEELDALILRNAPVDWLKTLEAIADPVIDTSMSELLELQGKTFTKSEEELMTAKSQSNNTMLSDQEIMDLITKTINPSTN
jgi:hypothetical protein